uniref:Uncharacterized protein n=1 Tax=Mycena chlorophos TaxID=658473 RepID=A0ABQ0LV08_MYCCL|nr:predicted protein [Mycena chlorophos]
MGKSTHIQVLEGVVCRVTCNISVDFSKPVLGPGGTQPTVHAPDYPSAFPRTTLSTPGPTTSLRVTTHPATGAAFQPGRHCPFPRSSSAFTIAARTTMVIALCHRSPPLPRGARDDHGCWPVRTRSSTVHVAGSYALHYGKPRLRLETHGAWDETPDVVFWATVGQTPRPSRSRTRDPQPIPASSLPSIVSGSRIPAQLGATTNFLAVVAYTPGGYVVYVEVRLHRLAVVTGHWNGTLAVYPQAEPKSCSGTTRPSFVPTCLDLTHNCVRRHDYERLRSRVLMRAGGGVRDWHCAAPSAGRKQSERLSSFGASSHSFFHGLPSSALTIP